MKKYILILLIILTGCEANKLEDYTVKVSVTGNASYEVEFTELPKGENNPIIMSRYSPGYSNTVTVDVVSEPPLIVRAKHLATSACITLEVNDEYKTECGKVVEIWLSCE